MVDDDPLDIDLALVLGAAVAYAFGTYAKAHGDSAEPHYETDPLPSGFDHRATIRVDDGITTDLLGEAFSRAFGDALRFTKPIGEILVRDGVWIVAFRGTRGLVEEINNANVGLVRFRRAGRVHRGFSRLYERCLACPVSGPKRPLAEYVRKEAANRPVAVTGHSLGAALATLCAADLALRHRFADLRVVTFASPRVGSAEFARAFDKRVPRCWRIVNEPDAVPALPFAGMGYHHAGRPVRVDSSGHSRFTMAAFHDLRTYLHELAPDRMPFPDAHLPN